MRAGGSLPGLLICAMIAGCAVSGKNNMDTTKPSIHCSGQTDAFAQHFQNLTGTFVLFDAQSGRTLCHNPQRARTRYLPASTFKIPNTLIALEAGVASGPQFFLPYRPVLLVRRTAHLC
jgi:beta-lactamase class D